MKNDDFIGPVNIGSEEMVTINQLVEAVGRIAKKDFSINHVSGPLGVRGRNSDNTLIRNVLAWEYEWSLEKGLESTYAWISAQIQSNKLSQPEYLSREFIIYDTYFCNRSSL